MSFESSFQLSPARSNILSFFLAVMTLMHSNPTSYTFLAKLIKSFLPQNSELGFSSQHSPSFLFQLQCRKDELVDRTSGIVDQVHQLAVVGSGFQLPGEETERRILGSKESQRLRSRFSGIQFSTEVTFELSTWLSRLRIWLIVKNKTKNIIFFNQVSSTGPS